MRHAKADWHSHTADIDRPLNERGVRDAECMAAWMQQKSIVPDKMIVSPAQRTQQTAMLLLKCFQRTEPQLVVDKELYLADRETLCDIIVDYAKPDERLLLLAHNPGMDYLVSYLAAEPPPMSPGGKLMTTCAAACFSVTSVEALNRGGQCRLQDLIRPKEIV